MTHETSNRQSTREFESLQALQNHVGEELACSDWMTVDQARIDLFAEATGDHQWIHVDPVRAASGPFRGTIAHGLLTLSMIPMLMSQAMTIHNVQMGVNCGSNKVRYASPVLAGSRVRGRFTLASMTPLQPLNGVDGFEMVFDVVVECEGSGKPACVAQLVSRRYG
ncbi:MaoC family dehydratase [Cupriavidus necator]|uniref:MaoC family dehydratase n=1 Tax=Cupriavidus necator TaxID=106590 RepID=UPI003ED16BA7